VVTIAQTGSLAVSPQGAEEHMWLWKLCHYIPKRERRGVAENDNIKWVQALAFSVDMSWHLYEWNIRLQGKCKRGKPIYDGIGTLKNINFLKFK
jgi:hypothetical protein